MPRILADALSDALAMLFDPNKPVRTRDGRRVMNLRPFGSDFLQFEVEGVPDTTYSKFASNGRSYSGGPFEMPDDLVNLTEQTNHTRRSLRPDLTYQLRDGRPVTIVVWDVDNPDASIVIRYPASEADRLYFPKKKEAVAQRHKSGRMYPSGPDTDLDVIEVTQTITKWVRVYDERKILVENKPSRQLVGPAKNKVEINASIPQNWYVFDTELEARASLQGVRAVFQIQYKEGEGV